MRPVGERQSVLEYPLNEILGRESHVRIIRLLANQLEPIGVSLIAQQSGLTVAGAKKAINKLVSLGFLEEVGGSRQRQYALRLEDQLSRAVVALFEAESLQYRELVQSLRDVMRRSRVPIETAWIESAGNEDRKTIEVGFVAPIRQLQEAHDGLRSRLLVMEARFDVSIELVAYSKADVAFVKSDDVTTVFGPESITKESEEVGAMTHRDMDERARQWAYILRDLVRNDPTVVKRARVWLSDRIIEGVGSAKRDAEEWLRILSTYSKQQILDFLVSESPRAHRLRQSSPFAAVLSDEQRELLSRQAGKGKNDA